MRRNLLRSRDLAPSRTSTHWPLRSLVISRSSVQSRVPAPSNPNIDSDLRGSVSRAPRGAGSIRTLSVHYESTMTGSGATAGRLSPVEITSDRLVLLPFSHPLDELLEVGREIGLRRYTWFDAGCTTEPLEDTEIGRRGGGE